MPVIPSPGEAPASLTPWYLRQLRILEETSPAHLRGEVGGEPMPASHLYQPSLKGCKPKPERGLCITRTASTMETEASTYLTVSRGLVWETQSPRVQEDGDKEAL